VAAQAARVVGARARVQLREDVGGDRQQAVRRGEIAQRPAPAAEVGQLVGPREVSVALHRRAHVHRLLEHDVGLEEPRLRVEHAEVVDEVDHARVVVAVDGAVGGEGAVVQGGGGLRVAAALRAHRGQRLQARDLRVAGGEERDARGQGPVEAGLGLGQVLLADHDGREALEGEGDGEVVPGAALLEEGERAAEGLGRGDAVVEREGAGAEVELDPRARLEAGRPGGRQGAVGPQEQVARLRVSPGVVGGRRRGVQIGLAGAGETRQQQDQAAAGVVRWQAIRFPSRTTIVSRLQQAAQGPQAVQHVHAQGAGVAAGALGDGHERLLLREMPAHQIAAERLHRGQRAVHPDQVLLAAEPLDGIGVVARELRVEVGEDPPAADPVDRPREGDALHEGVQADAEDEAVALEREHQAHQRLLHQVLDLVGGDPQARAAHRLARPRRDQPAGFGVARQEGQPQVVVVLHGAGALWGRLRRGRHPPMVAHGSVASASVPKRRRRWFGWTDEALRP
jgi:hypothetical protein